jgi:hypothetical protein
MLDWIATRRADNECITNGAWITSFGSRRASEMTRRRLAVAAAAFTLLACVAEAGIETARSQTPLHATGDVTHYRTATIDEISLFYREAGPSTGPVVVLLHGFPRSSHMFRNLIPALADGYHVIAPDYPGFGQSAALTTRSSLTPLHTTPAWWTRCCSTSGPRVTRCTSWITVHLSASAWHYCTPSVSLH